MPANQETKTAVLENVYDRLAALDFPEGYDEVVRREVDRAVSWVETRIRTSLSPARFTDLPRSAEEAYANRATYEQQISPAMRSYPEWDQLTDPQRAIYNNVPGFYQPGSLPWESLSPEQQMVWATNVKYAENKIGPAERQDGRGTSYIRLFRGRVLDVYSVTISFPFTPGQPTANTMGRTYYRRDLAVYEREGAIRIFPAAMSRILNGSGGDSLWASQFGTVAPRIPQAVRVDYEFGFREVPLDLIDAVALRVAVQVIPQISALMTGGLGGFGVDGFNVSFNQGLFGDLLKGFQTELDGKLAPYYTPYMTGW